MKKLFKFAAVLPLLLIATLALFRLLAQLRETEMPQTLAPANGQFIHTTYGAVHINEWGSANKPVVVMTHGMAAWGGLWKETAEFLAANGYHVIAFDQAPFGFSDATTENYSTFAEADRIGQALGSLGVKNAKLVGHSFGGGVAIETVLQFPNFFNGVVLVCPVTKLGKADAAVKTEAYWIWRQGWISETLVSATITNPLMTKILLQRFMARKDMATSEQIRILQVPMNRIGNTHAMAVWLRQFFEGDPDGKTAMTNAAEQFRVPVSFIWGEQDNVVSIDEAHRLEVLLKGLRLDIISGVGHMPQLESPEKFRALLVLQLQALPNN